MILRAGSFPALRNVNVEIGNMDKDEAVSFVQEKIGYVFRNEDYLLEALTHSSYTNEMKILKRADYERLEFLGDAVLELITSEYLYEEYPRVPEGGLSKKRASLVCEPSLAICARRMELGKAIFMGKGEETSGGRDRDAVLCDITESVLGAIYLDGGLDEARKYVKNHVLHVLKENELFVDSKSVLQEFVQKKFNDKPLSYDLLSESGPEHNKTFTVCVKLGDEVLATAEGKSKKFAQQIAASEAIKILRNRTDD